MTSLRVVYGTEEHVSEPHATAQPNRDIEIADFDATEDQSLGQYIPLHYHYNMLQDECRVNAFRDAINQHVRPGMHVMELGGGTGILSSFAARLGAQVTCVERNPALVTASRRLIEANGLSNLIEVVQADARTYVPTKPVDVVVCEMLHVGLLREKQAQVIDDFKRNYASRFASKMPHFLPESSVLMVQPVEHCFEYAGYWAPVPLFQSPYETQPRTVEFTTLQPYSSINYDEAIPMRFDFKESFPATRTGWVNAVRLVTQNIISLDETNQHVIAWPNQCLVVPLLHPFDVIENQSIAIEFHYEAGGTLESFTDSVQVSLNTKTLRHAA